MTPGQTVDRYTVTRNENGLGFSNGIEPDAAGGFVSYEDYLAQREQIEALQKRVKAALERLDASLFTNAEHQQAKSILRATEEQDNE
jgi:hypothetical protein